MNDAKKAALAAIDEKKELVAEVADAIWDYAELSMQEVKSAALFVKVLKAEGFQVEEGICGIPTAFSGTFGSGLPVVRTVVELDGTGLDGNATLPLQIHGVQDLGRHLPLVNGVALLQKAVCQGGLAVVNMGNDGKITDMA